MNSPVSLGLLRSIAAFETSHGAGPSFDELALDVGIPPEFGHHLESCLRRELALGRVSSIGGRYRLTATGRVGLDLLRAPEPAG